MVFSFRSLITITVSVCLTFSAVAGSVYFPFLDVTVAIADSADGARFLSQDDAYLSHLSTFDMHGRFMDKKSHTVQEYLQYAAANTRNCEVQDQETVKKSFGAIADFIKNNKLQLHLPDTIWFIRSTCAEEFGASGYTRRNGIVIKTGEGISTGLVAHELFHVMTRNDPKLADELYQNIGFKKCNDIKIAPFMDGLNITNPDCPYYRHYITVGDKEYILVFYSKKPYNGGTVFESKDLDIKLMQLTGDDTHKKPAIKDGMPVLYSLDENPGIMQQIGVNTNYILHPEEICAEHFAALVTNKQVPQPEFLEKMKAKLK